MIISAFLQTITYSLISTTNKITSDFLQKILTALIWQRYLIDYINRLTGALLSDGLLQSGD